MEINNKVMMNQEDIYQAEQDYARYANLVLKANTLTQEEYEFVKEWDPQAAEAMFHIEWNNTYLNLNTYSEADKEEMDLRREQGL
jgi:hypothetical protein